MKFMNKILLFLVIAMFVAIPGFAQTGNVHGKVTDTDGKPMVGATISIDRQGITQHFEVKTDNRGQYLHAVVSLDFKMLSDALSINRDRGADHRLAIGVGHFPMNVAGL